MLNKTSYYNGLKTGTTKTAGAWLVSYSHRMVYETVRNLIYLARQYVIRVFNQKPTSRCLDSDRIPSMNSPHKI
jgi:D-alanyl-D-alanine carboxypeptidase